MFEILRLFQKGILAFLASSISERRVQKLPKIGSDILLRTRLLANKVSSWISKYIFLVVMTLKEKIVTAPPWIQTEREQYLEKQERYLLKFSPLYLTYQVFADARRFRSLSW